jgi:hypothetical protein
MKLSLFKKQLNTWEGSIKSNFEGLCAETVVAVVVLALKSDLLPCSECTKWRKTQKNEAKHEK